MFISLQEELGISVDEARKMVASTIDARDRAILLARFKTGIKRMELSTLDISDLDLMGDRLTLKLTPKRSNKIVFFDEECHCASVSWLKSREMRYKVKGEQAIFISNKGRKLQGSGIDILVREAATRVGLYDSDSTQREDKFTPHCGRHWNATHLLRTGMPREFAQWLRGDAMRKAIDIHNHIDQGDVKKSYLAHIPQLGV